MNQPIAPDKLKLFSVPARVYAASDGIFPQWRFLLVAYNPGPEALTLERVVQARGLSWGAGQAECRWRQAPLEAGHAGDAEWRGGRGGGICFRASQAVPRPR